MIAIQRITDEVRAQLAAKDWTLTDRLRLLADEYASACHETESRLRRCEELAKSGYRGEAIYLAELDPPLLELVTILAFPERKLWSDVVAMYGFTEPPPLSLDRAQALNQVYSDYAIVEPLVQKLRRLSRSRATLDERARALRELLAKDPNCPIWSEQLIAVESELRADIVRAVDRELAAGDRSRMTEHYLALTAPGWRVPAAPQVAARVANECAPQAVLRISTAIARRDFSAARTALSDWDRMAAHARIVAEHPLAIRVKGLELQLEHQERDAGDDADRQIAISELRQVIRGSSDEVELSSAYERARATGARIPRPLADRTCLAPLRPEEGAEEPSEGAADEGEGVEAPLFAGRQH